MLNIHGIPAFSDNYIWLLQNPRDSLAWVVDPGDSTAVELTLEQNKLQLAGILVTHHHYDHTQGIQSLVEKHQVPVIGPNTITGVSQAVEDQDVIQIAGSNWQILTVPGHTLDHLAYFCLDAETPILFCGDTLFSAGCGRLFEGTAKQMYRSLQRLSALPDNTAIYCTHEYTESNLRFAQTVEPKNVSIDTFLQSAPWSAQQPSLPSSLTREKLINPFLRCDVETVIQAALKRGASSSKAEDIFAALRLWKDNF